MLVKNTLKEHIKELAVSFHKIYLIIQVRVKRGVAPK